METLETGLIVAALVLVALALVRRILVGRRSKPGLFSISGRVSFFSTSPDHTDGDD